MIWSAGELAEVPPGVVTLMSTVPAERAGLVATIRLTVSLTIVPAVVPKSTAVAPARLAPVIVTFRPPATGLSVGLTAVTAGAAV